MSEQYHNSRRYAGPDARALAFALSGSTGRQPKQSAGWWRVPGVCHGGDAPGTLAIKDHDQGGIAVFCPKCDSRQAIVQAIERATQTRIWDAWVEDAPRRKSPNAPPGGQRRARTPQKRGRRVNPRPEAANTPGARENGPERSKTSRWWLRLWLKSEPIPAGDNHPARRWAARRNLWRPEIPMPQGLRWIPSAALPKSEAHQGAGALIVAYGPLASWIERWPLAAIPAGVELIHVDQDGRPCLDRPESEGGIPKRSYGRPKSGALIIGRPDRPDGLRVCEGPADGLALAARTPATVIATRGANGMRDPALAAGIAGYGQAVEVWADNDPDGLAAAETLQAGLVAGGLAINQAKIIAPAGKDPADTAGPFEPLAFADCLSAARAYVEVHDIPLFESLRLHSQLQFAHHQED